MGIIEFQNKVCDELRKHEAPHVCDNIAFLIALNRLAIEYAESFHREVMERAQLGKGKIE